MIFAQIIYVITQLSIYRYKGQWTYTTDVMFYVLRTCISTITLNDNVNVHILC